MNLFNTNLIQSISFSQEEILQSIIELYAPAGIELDATYNKGSFYNHIKEPKYKFDITPLLPTVIQGDARCLPLGQGEISSAIFDPPFVITDHKESDHYIMHKRYSSFKVISELREMYSSSIKEHFRILKPGGILIFKCQDTTHGKKNYFIHNEVYNMCCGNGFIALDLFILLSKHRFIGGVYKQRTARKFHCYFWVFRKAKRLKFLNDQV